MQESICERVLLSMLVLTICGLNFCGGGGKGKECIMGQKNCDGRCTNIMFDPANCGDCGNVCSAAENAHPVCTGGVCGWECDGGYVDIDGNEENGCEYECFIYGPEVCNGRDDDCNGIVDDGQTGGIPWNCVKGEEVPCKTACDQEGQQTGTRLCPDTCMIEDAGECVPPAEQCNGVDDDCDGEVDNGSTDGKSWDCVMGSEVECEFECRAGGTTRIIKGVAICPETCFISDITDCSPPPEQCNGEDDDCDGVVDNGSTDGSEWDCIMGEEVLCKTSCDPDGEKTGSGVCPDSCFSDDIPLQECSPPDELCNGRDDDCDGELDEDVFGNLFGEGRVSNMDGDVGKIDVAWTGSEFAVVWSGRGTDGWWDIYFATVNEDGTVSIAPHSVISSSTGGDKIAPSLVFDGSDGAIVWVEDVGEPAGEPLMKVHYIAIGTDGTPVFSPPVMLNADGDQESEPEIISFSGGMIVVWVSDSGTGQSVMRAIVRSDGSFVVPPSFVSSQTGQKMQPQVAWSGRVFLVLWADPRLGTKEIFSTVLDSGGSVIAGKFDTRTYSLISDIDLYGVVWDGYNFSTVVSGAVAGGGKVGYVVIISEDGEGLGDLEIDVGEGGSMDVLYAEGEYPHVAFVWSDTSGEEGEIFFQRVTPAGSIDHYVVHEPVIQLTFAGDSLAPVVAFSGDVYLVAWKDNRGEGFEVYQSPVGCF